MSEQKGDELLSRFIGYILRIFFCLLYNQFAWTYDFVADIVSLGRWKSWIYSVIPGLGSSEVLELGHGPGHLLVALFQHGYSAFGIDASPYMVRIAAKRLNRNGCPRQLVLGKSQYLPYPDNQFKSVVSTFPSEYIYEPMTIQEIWRVLDSRGEFVVLAGAWITGERWLEKLASWLFLITGQAPRPDSDEFKDQLIRQLDSARIIGFQTSTEYMELQDSKMLLVRAQKIAPKNL
jgi:ubiquinone/menaquinone biosynthesis C-methylase UbiE